MKSLRNTKGAVVETVIIVLLVVMILGGGIVSIAYSYYKRSFDDANSRRAYLNASSIAQTIGREIASKNNKSEYEKYVPDDKAYPVTLTNLKLDDNDLKSKGTISINDKKTELTIKISTTVSGQTRTATQTLLKNSSDETIWQLGKLK